MCGFAHIGSHSVGVVANQPRCSPVVLDINASVKGARFVRFCDAFNIPIVTFEDVPVFSRAWRRSTAGSSGTVAKLLYAYCKRRCPSSP